MIEDFRHFEVRDPFGQIWAIDFEWLQTAISIRHSDSVDVKFRLSSGEERMEKVVALMHPDLLALSREQGRPITDAWCSRLAASHLKRAMETGEDAEKELITARLSQLETCLPAARG